MNIMSYLIRGDQNLPDLVICGQVAYNIESCPYLASGMVNKTPTGHLLPAPPANYEIFETSSKYIYTCIPIDAEFYADFKNVYLCIPILQIF